MIAKHWKRHVRSGTGADVEQRVLVTYSRGRETVHARGFSYGRVAHHWQVYDVTERDCTDTLLAGFDSEDRCRFWLLDQHFRSFIPEAAPALQEASR